MQVAAGRSAAEVAVGLNQRDWRAAVESARSQGVSAVRVRHILVETEGLAELLRAQLREGAEFEELAAACSTCAATREKGGEIGWSGVEDEHLDEILPRSVRAPARFAARPSSDWSQLGLAARLTR